MTIPTNDQQDDVDAILLGIENWVDNQHIPSNNGSYRLSPEEAQAAINTLLVRARIDELQKLHDSEIANKSINAMKIRVNGRLGVLEAELKGDE